MVEALFLEHFQLSGLTDSLLHVTQCGKDDLETLASCATDAGQDSSASTGRRENSEKKLGSTFFCASFPRRSIKAITIPAPSTL
jgi:hypothetical protein